MKETALPPEIDRRGVCIVDKNKSVLAAVVSSYFSVPGSYFSVFAFPANINVDDVDGDFFQEDSYMSRAIGSETGTWINNALSRIENCQLVVLVGLNDHQKTYLHFPKNVQIIEIVNLEEVSEKLEPIVGKKEKLECKEADILAGLFTAKKYDKQLVISKNANYTPKLPIEEGKGIVVLENSEEVFSVVAVNYACSVNANLCIVDPLKKEEKKKAEKNIMKWWENKSYNQLQKVVNEVLRRVGEIPFTKLKYATFFTVGLPYSLGIKNVIPCCYVNLSLRPDLFVINSILFENREKFNSAVVFSPGFFKDEETDEVISILEKSSYYIRGLRGRDATVRNLDFHVQHFPYDIFHICTHGGEVDGYSVVEEFVDRDGEKHIVEYDEVIGFSPVPGAELIELHRKVIFKKFNGYTWMSPELRQQKYPASVFEDMRKKLFQSKGDLGKAKRIPKSKIPTSCAIACVDSIHQGTFRVLASHSSPIVFNNACWSWSEVAVFFLACGARGYIGTLWAIGNSEAVAGARAFYNSIFGNTILNAFFDATKALKGTPSENIYVFWGLHFSTLSPASNPDNSRQLVFKGLVGSFYLWTKKINSIKSKEVKRNSIIVVESIFSEIMKNFRPQDLKGLQEVYKAEITKHGEESRSNIEGKEGIDFKDIPSIDCPTEFRKSS